MIYLLYIYFGINLMILGSYFFDNSEGHSVFEKIFCILFLFFFGGFLVVAELTIAEKIAKWWHSSELNFLWRVYIKQQYDKLHPSQVKYLNDKLLEEKNKNSKYYKHLKTILNRNKLINGSKEI